jgi:hypothetical protein
VIDESGHEMQSRNTAPYGIKFYKYIPLLELTEPDPYLRFVQIEGLNLVFDINTAVLVGSAPSLRARARQAVARGLQRGSFLAAHGEAMEILHACFGNGVAFMDEFPDNVSTDENALSHKKASRADIKKAARKLGKQMARHGRDVRVRLCLRKSDTTLSSMKK